MGVGLPPQGFFWWPGIDTFLHGSFSFTHGITPSLATLYIAPQFSWPDMAGVFTVNYLPGGASYSFTDCLLDFISIERESDGRQVWGLHILDRRWKWKDCGRISGNYNIRLSNGDGDEDIFQPSAKPLVEMMQLCLSAMGEDVYGFDLSQVVENAFPEVEWDYENPSRALLELCDQFGYRVILNLQNQVLIAKANQGNYLPDFQFLSGATTVNPPNTPSSLVIAAGKTVVQFDFKLTAMALELDGSLVPLNLVSYKPTTENGWGDIDLPEFNLVGNGSDLSIARSYAKKSVFKYYQITAPFTMEGLDPLNPQNDEVTSILRVLPLMDTQLVKAPPFLQAENEDSDEPVYEPGQPIPAWVYGIWYTYENDPKNAITEVDSSIDTPDQARGYYPYGFQIDGKRGLVIFEDYTFSIPPAIDAISGEPTGEPDLKLPAQLYLRTTCNVRDVQTLGWLRSETSFDLPDAGTPTLPMYVKSDDIARKIIYFFTGVGEVDGDNDNAEQVQGQANYQLQAELKKLQIQDPQSFEYPGFVFFDLDGAIQQITWNVGDDGRATTQCNRCKEDLVNTQSYEEAKQAALLRMNLDKNKVGRLKQQSAQQTLSMGGLAGLVGK